VLTVVDEVEVVVVVGAGVVDVVVEDVSASVLASTASIIAVTVTIVVLLVDVVGSSDISCTSGSAVVAVALLELVASCSFARSVSARSFL
jgi:hypothetical protein